MKHERNAIFWLRWVLANTVGEAVGLSVVLLVGFGVLGPRLAGLTGAWPAVVGLVAGVLLGIFEGIVVGAAQGVILRRRLPRLALRTWILVTVIGAMVAWGLGMLPSTLMSADASGGQAAAEMSEALTYVMAAGMGLVAGVILALAQWLALRSLGSQVRRPGLWLPANALAWLCGMPLVFLGMGAIPTGASVLQALPIVVAATAAAGAVVGAIHGLVLVKALLPGAW
ncbi:MAG: hypothetical protein NT169_15610 [Chloroflexi bacterium]|nr:hypothetical protein [Chloroflexota bacterium]